ncbi:TipJ family phage tail tip protein [Inquilinus limosus]|uniref:Fibronectin type-III domain-containing protein n=1 Tax=Inquilinus limosus MP06 TaxID=1398085 RepID=A0A0A0DDB6_9PROT|nr:phage tail protein [Inquilinus limosus]KGM36124.1 hypothetical protein P409_00310 [Inquilinus limosus MP06]
MEILLGLCEGPIKGLTRGDKDFRIGETSLQSEAGDYNFQKYTLDILPGEHAPPPVKLVLGGSSQPTTVNVNLMKDVPVTRETSTGQIDAIEVRLRIDQLYHQNDDGVFEQDIEFKIEFKPLSAATWANFYDDAEINITGKTTQAYVKEFRRTVPRINEPYLIRVTKVDPESTSERVREMVWESFQEVDAIPRTYPDTALVHFVAEASDQFSSLPTFSGVYDGLIVQVPSNYDPIARTYSGIWDGTFKMAWTNNGPWILYAVLTNDRWGWSSYQPVTVDKYVFYEAAQWCDGRIGPNQRPRYTFNAYIQDPMNGREFARYIAGSFNGAVVEDDNNVVHLLVDKEEAAVAIFTQESIDGDFQYSYTDVTSRINDLTVVYLNPELNWAQDRRRIFDQADIDLNGRVPLDFVAVGCTNTEEAIGRAYYKMLTSLTETEMVTFTTNRRGLFVNPWEIILIADPNMGYGISGRIKTLSPSGTVIGLRDPVFLEAGVTYAIRVQYHDRVETRTITTPPGSTTTLSVAGGLPTADYVEDAVFTLESDHDGLPKAYRVIKREELDGNPDQIQIFATEVNRSKWALADNPPVVGGDVDIIDLPVSVVSPPINPRVTYSKRYDHLGGHMVLTVDWDRSPSKFVTKYLVDYTRNGSERQLLTETTTTIAELVDAPLGDYVFYIRARTVSNITSEPAVATFKLGNTTRQVDPVTNVRVLNGVTNTEFDVAEPFFTWDVPKPDPAFHHFEVVIRDIDNEIVISTHTTTSREWQYTSSMSDEDGKKRSFIVGVTVCDPWGNRSIEVQTTASNPPPHIPFQLKVEQTFEGFRINYDRPSIRDFGGTKVWASTEENFTISDETLVYQGPNTAYEHHRPEFWYIRVASFDTYNPNDFLVSPQMTVRSYLEGFEPIPSLLDKIGFGEERNEWLANALANAQFALYKETGNARAAIIEERNIRVTEDEALAQSIDTIAVQVGDNAAAIQNEATARATADSAMATQISTMDVRVGDAETKIQTQQTIIDGVSGQYVVKIDNNGVMSGFQLVSDYTGGTVESSFIVSANNFLIWDGSLGRAPFTIESGDIKMDADVWIKNLSVDTLKIKDGAISSITAAQPADVVDIPAKDEGISGYNENDPSTWRWTNIGSISVTAFAAGRTMFNVSFLGKTAGDNQGHYRLLRDGSLLKVFTYIQYLDKWLTQSMSIIDTGAPAGAHTYTLQACSDAAGDKVDMSNIILSLIELKR